MPPRAIRRRPSKALDKLDQNDRFENFKSYHGALIADYLGASMRAEVFYKKAYAQAGTSLRVVQAYGNYLERNGRKDEARKVYEQFLVERREEPAGRARRSPMLDKAAKPQSLRRRPMQRHGEALFSVASALSDDQGLDVALAYAQLALSVDGDRTISLTLLGDIYESMNYYQRSIERL